MVSDGGDGRLRVSLWHRGESAHSARGALRENNGEDHQVHGEPQTKKVGGLVLSCGSSVAADTVLYS